MKNVKKTNLKKKKKKRGFTLIELLAVIIILGVLMIIAIPSVTEYIQSSRKSSYISTASNYVTGARTMVNSAEVPMYDTTATYYLPTSCIALESGGDSPFGDLEEGYVVVTYDGSGYDYYFTSRDSANMGILLTNVDLLDNTRVMTGIESLDTTIAIEGTKKIIMVEDCKSSVTEKPATATIPKKGSYDKEQGNLTPINVVPYFGKVYHCYDLRNDRNTYMGASLIFYENGDGAAYNKETGDASFVANSYRYENSYLMNVGDSKALASISSDKSAIDFNDGDYGLDNLWWTCLVSDETNNIVFDAPYSTTVTEDGTEVTLTIKFSQDGSMTASTSAGFSNTLPAGTFIYDIPTKIVSTTGDIGNLDISENGRTITVEGLAYELQK